MGRRSAASDDSGVDLATATGATKARGHRLISDRASFGPVQLESATLWYLGNDSTAPARAEPTLVSVLDTPLGMAGQILVPLTYREMLRDRERLTYLASSAIDAAARLGASNVSLAGMLAGALRYGRAFSGPALPVTTGHAATALSVLRATEQVLKACDRDWPDERVAAVGVGSVGESCVRAALQTLGTPRQLTLVDLPGRAGFIETLANSLRSRHPGLEVNFCPAGKAEGALKEATLVLGASGVPSVLRVLELRPGVIIVDDSVPNCFNVGEALRRAATAGDIVFTNGGYFAFNRPYALVPVRYDAGTPSLMRSKQVRTTQIASCFSAPLLMAHDAELPTTTGPGVAPEVVAAFGTAAARHQVGPGPIACRGRMPDPGYLEAFGARFGRSA